MKNIPNYFIAFVYIVAILLQYYKGKRLLDICEMKKKRFLFDQVLGIEKISMWVTVMFMVKYSGITNYSTATCILTIISGILFLRYNKETSLIEFFSSISCMALVGLIHIVWYALLVLE